MPREVSTWESVGMSEVLCKIRASNDKQQALRGSSISHALLEIDYACRQVQGRPIIQCFLSGYRPLNSYGTFLIKTKPQRHPSLLHASITQANVYLSGFLDLLGTKVRHTLLRDRSLQLRLSSRPRPHLTLAALGNASLRPLTTAFLSVPRATY